MGLIGQLGLLAGLPLFKIFGDDVTYGARTFVIDNWDVFLHWVYHFSAAFLVVDPFSDIFLVFSPTAQATGVFSHSKGFGAERSSTKTHSPRFPNRGSQIEVPK